MSRTAAACSRSVSSRKGGLQAYATRSAGQANDHPGLFNPAEWGSTSGPGRVFSVNDFRRLNLRFPASPDFYTQLDVGQYAPTTLRGTFPTDRSYRLDPAHANRLLFTPLGATLDRPGLMPNFPSVAPGAAESCTVPV